MNCKYELQKYNSCVSEKKKPQPLTIYLAKDTFANIEDIVKEPSSHKQYAIKCGKSTTAKLYVPISKSKYPKWVGFFSTQISITDFNQVSSAGALLVIKHAKKIFALSFGSKGRFLLLQDCFEERFGLRVALNCIGPDSLKSIDKNTLDSLSRHTREQASRDAAPSEFGLDVEKDLVCAVTGTPSDPSLGRRITGMDALHIAVPVVLEDLPDLLDKVYAKYIDKSYQKTFPWVDQITEIKDHKLRTTLNALLIERLKSERRENLWMAIPEVITWGNVGGFRFPSPKSQIEHHDIHLEHFINSLRSPENIDEATLKSRIVECVDYDGVILQKWKIYRCLYCEIEYEGNTYLLNSGSWYKVNNDLVKQVDSAIKQIPEYIHSLPEYNDKSEGEYSKRAAKELSTILSVMDAKTIMYGGGQSKIEFCDLITSKKDLIHIKRYGQSAALSHLFSQGLVSGELFQTDPEFRRLLNPKLPKTHQLADTNQRPKQDEYQIVFAIISDRQGELKLPFFSRLNLKHAVRRLQGYGFRVAKAKISVNAEYAKLQKIKSRKRAA